MVRLGTLLIVTACVCAQGCGPSGPTRLKLQFDVSNKTNDDNPLVVDVVVAYDPETFEELGQMTASQWFDSRDAKILNNPGEALFKTRRWEITPGLDMESQELPLPGVPSQGVLFAGYNSRGKHASRFDPARAQTVQLLRESFRVTPGKITDPPTWSPKSVSGWGSIALGAVGIGMGMYFSLEAVKHAIATQDKKPRDEPDYNNSVDSVETNRDRMLISYGAGVGLLAIGATILLWPEDDASPFSPITDPNADLGGMILRW
jgi:hypothetical protein